MCDMHARSPQPPRMHIEINPAKQKWLFFPGYVVQKRWGMGGGTKERSVADFVMFIHDRLHLTEVTRFYMNNLLNV